MTTGPCTEPARVSAPRRPRIRSIVADLTVAGSATGALESAEIA